MFLYSDIVRIPGRRTAPAKLTHTLPAHCQRRKMTMTPQRKICFVLLLALAGQIASAQMRVLVDQVGYEADAPKIALVSDLPVSAPSAFELIDDKTGKPVFHGSLSEHDEVPGWSSAHYWRADFSAWTAPGRYLLRVSSASGSVCSSLFEIDHDLLERATLSNVIYYFKTQRATGEMERVDRHLAVPGSPGEFIDAHGGWWDATGDYGKHLSHQNLTSFFNPQQIPLTAWTLLRSYQLLHERGDDNFTEYERRLLDEGLYGADFLVRIYRPGASFLETIEAPGPGKLATDRVIGNPNWRTRIKTATGDSTQTLESIDGPLRYQSGYRSGAGLAIAALALAARMPIDGEFSRSDYLRTAEAAFVFLEEHNRELLNDGTENILDDYCALLASTELYNTTHKEVYLKASSRHAAQLIGRLVSAGPWSGSWRADAGSRPFFHPSDAGLPVVSLLAFYPIASAAERVRIRQTVERSLRFELRVTSELSNPFGYARQLVRRADGTPRTAFFFPHDTEAAPWWQGENARLASLAAVARLAAPLFDDQPQFQSELRDYAWNQLHWILGRNPFDVSMLIGSGHGDTTYMYFRSWKYASAPGAILNGITAGPNGETGIAYNQGFAVTGKDEDWRWTEQWLPHASWYLFAVSLPHR
jgi:hypothetical protein